jgi:chromate reductase, NAD(P)H dehydrogenase (quinone)
MTRVAVIVGSLSKNSVNRAFAQALGRFAAPKLQFDFVEIGDLPFYHQDHEAVPAVVQRFKDRIKAADAVLFVTPEYLRTIPAVLKNAIEWGQMPWGTTVWAGKPGAIAGVSIGAVGTAVAQSHLRSIASVLDIALISQPELYITMRPGLIAENGEFADEAFRTVLQTWVDRFSAWIARLEQKPALQF